jgi:hypothetical protein
MSGCKQEQANDDPAYAMTKGAKARQWFWLSCDHIFVAIRDVYHFERWNRSFNLYYYYFFFPKISDQAVIFMPSFSRRQESIRQI